MDLIAATENRTSAHGSRMRRAVPNTVRRVMDPEIRDYRGSSRPTGGPKISDGVCATGKCGSAKAGVAEAYLKGYVPAHPTPAQPYYPVALRVERHSDIRGVGEAGTASPTTPRLAACRLALNADPAGDFRTSPSRWPPSRIVTG